jgi:phosphoribosylamine--glycine ligase
MKILVVGGGGREHAICRAFKKSSKVTKIFCANGNAGIAEIAECLDIKPDEIERLASFASENEIDLTFVGGETALALGIVDEFENKGLKIIGANRQAAQLEASKAFAKDFMKRHEIPTAEYTIANSPEQAIQILQSGRFGDENSPVVVKADGLAAGKGVVVAQNRSAAEQAINELTAGDLISREAAERIVLEEFLIGIEISLLLFADGKNFALMPPVRDHKRIYDNDQGANTGGMGTICNENLLTLEQEQEIVEKIIKPTLSGAKIDGFEFRGVLFLGLMLTAEGAKLLEYNVRFGDPETQSILIRLETDFIDLCGAIQNQTLNELDIAWKMGSTACVILAAQNYPNKPKTGDMIRGLNEIGSNEDIVIFHSGTAMDGNGNFITAGGRVLGVTSIGDNLDVALNRAYDAVNKISFDGMQYRRDIGK